MKTHATQAIQCLQSVPSEWGRHIHGKGDGLGGKQGAKAVL